MGFIPPRSWRILTMHWWHLSRAESRRLWAALGRAQTARPRTMRQQVLMVEAVPLDLDHLFQQVLTPRMVVDVLEDLVQERQLGRAEGSRLEQRILAQVTPGGSGKMRHCDWKQTLQTMDSLGMPGGSGKRRYSECPARACTRAARAAQRRSWLVRYFWQHHF